MKQQRQGMARQSRPVRTMEQEAFLAIQKTADLLMRELAALLKPHGLSPTQYNVLRILRGAGACDPERRKGGGRAGGLACRDIAGRMLTHDPDVTRLLDRLEQRALITRGRGEQDRRVVTSRITADGLAVLKPLDPAVLDLHRRQLGHLPQSSLAELLKLLAIARGRSIAD